MIEIPDPFQWPVLSLSEEVTTKAEELLAQMTREEKLGLCHGNTTFTVAGIPRLGIPAMVMSDGPHGVRMDMRPDDFVPIGGMDDDTTYLPVGIALGATWSLECAEAFGDVLGAEARARGKDVILGPGVNLIRTPLCGRNFEYLGEDPAHVGPLAVVLSKAIQRHDVAGSVKHFALNNQELNRKSVDVEVDDQTLRELYLAAFELVVTRGGCLTVMGAYNKFRGQFCCQHKLLLQQILKDEWGFEGFALTDWGGVTSTEEGVRNGMDVEMGGNLKAHHLDEGFRQGLAEGRFAESLLDDKARRVLRVGGAIKMYSPGRAPGDRLNEKHRRIAHQIAREALVLLQNEDSILPLDPARLKKVLVVGDNADREHAMGGGSSGVPAEYEITPLSGLREALGENVAIDYVPGYPVRPSGIEPIPTACLGIADHAGIRGWRCAVYPSRKPQGEPRRYSVEAIPEVAPETIPLSDLKTGAWMVQWQATVTPEQSGTYQLAAEGGDYFEVKVNGAVVSSVWDLTAPFLSLEKVPLEAGKPVDIELSYRPKMEAQGFRFGWIPPHAKIETNQDPFAEAVEKAKNADTVIFFGGTNHFQDCEGADRHSMDLPGGQNELIERLVEANRRTIVVLFGGSAVELPWLNKIPAVVQAWYPGQEGGRALADVLLGEANPSGRLPISWPRQLADVSAHAHDAYGPDQVVYREGLKHGTRWHQGEGPDPLFPLGHGLSYTTFAYGDLAIDDTDPDLLRVEVTVTNTGNRSGREVVQCYGEEPGRGLELMNFAKVNLAAGQSERIRFTFSPSARRRWDSAQNGWRTERRPFTLHIGASAGDRRLSKEVF